MLLKPSNREIQELRTRFRVAIVFIIIMVMVVSVCVTQVGGADYLRKA